MEKNIDTVKTTARSSEFSATRPLPPIGSGRGDGSGDGPWTDRTHDSDDDQQSTTSSAAFDRPGEGKACPQVVRGFRPEMISDDEMEDEQQKQRSVSFTNGKPLIMKRMTYDGREITFVTLNTQTDWEWVEKADATNIGETSFQGYEDVVIVTDKQKTSGSPRSSAKKSSAKSSSKDSRKGSRKGSGKAGSRGEGSASMASNYQMPYNDEYGIPILDLSSDTDDSSDEEVSHRKIKDDRAFMPSVGPPNILQYQRESEKHDIKVEEPESRFPDFEKDHAGVTHGMFSGNCEFCSQPIKPFPTVEQQMKLPPENLYCCNDYREFVEFVLSTSTMMEEEHSKKALMIDIKPHEHVGSKQERNAAKEKAVQRMRERELQRRQQEASGLQQNFFASEAASVKYLKGIPAKFGGLTLKDMYGNAAPVPKAPILDVNIDPSEIVLHGLVDECGHCYNKSKYCGMGRSKRGDSVDLRSVPSLEGADENVAIKCYLIGRGHVPACEAYQMTQIAKYYMKGVQLSLEVARQMKTINYQLSSQKCLEEGWTLRAPSPLFDMFGDDVFTPEPLNPDDQLRDRPLIEKFYESGQKFLTMFPDGTGNVFYPSGKLAILISSVKLGQYNYTIHNDHPKKSDVCAVFEPNGYGYCYFPNGDIRLYIDQYGGIELDNYGSKRRKWSWKDQLTHVHAPPFQPICIGLNKHIGVRVMSQENIALTFSADKRSCRFNMGSRLKLVAPENAPLKEVEEEYIFLEEKKAQVDALLDKVENLLKFPNNPKLDKMLPPLHVTAKQHKTEKLKKDRQTFLAHQSAREKKQPSIIVN